MHALGVQSLMCHLKGLLGENQCLVECVNVSNMFPRDICQYLFGPGCEDWVSKGGESS